MQSLSRKTPILRRRSNLGVEDRWYYVDNSGKAHGPVSRDFLAALWLNGHLEAATEVRNDNWAEQTWSGISSLPDLYKWLQSKAITDKTQVGRVRKGGTDQALWELGPMEKEVKYESDDDEFTKEITTVLRNADENVLAQRIETAQEEEKASVDPREAMVFRSRHGKYNKTYQRPQTVGMMSTDVENINPRGTPFGLARTERPTTTFGEVERRPYPPTAINAERHKTFSRSQSTKNVGFSENTPRSQEDVDVSRLRPHSNTAVSDGKSPDERLAMPMDSRASSRGTARPMSLKSNNSSHSHPSQEVERVWRNRQMAESRQSMVSRGSVRIQGVSSVNGVPEPLYQHRNQDKSPDLDHEKAIDQMVNDVVLANASEKAHSHRWAPSRAKSYEEDSSKSGVFSSLGDEYFDLGNHKTALQYFERQLKTSRKEGDDNAEVSALLNCARAIYEMGERQEAMSHLEEAMQLAEDINDARGTCQALGTMGSWKLRENHHMEGLELFRQQYEVGKEIMVVSHIATALIGMGQASQALFRMNDALRYFGDSIDYLKELRDFKKMTAVFGLMGELYTSIGKHDEALEILEKQMNMASGLGESAIIADAWCSLGVANLAKGDHVEAVRCHREQLDIAMSRGNKGEEYAAYIAYGDALWMGRDFEEAIKAYEEGRECAEALESWEKLCKAHLKLTMALESIEHFERSIRLHNSVLTRLDHNPLSKNSVAGVEYRAYIEMHKGFCQQSLGNFNGARRSYENSLTHARQINSTLVQGKVKWRMAELMKEQGLSRQSTALFKQAREMYAIHNQKAKLEDGPALRDEGSVLEQTAFAHLSGGNVSKSIACLQECLDLLHNDRQDATDEDTHMKMEREMHINLHLADAHAAAGHHDLAVQYTVRCREIALLLEDKRMEANVLFKRGLSHKEMGSYDEAQEDLEAAQELFSSEVNTLAVAKTCCELGKLKTETESYQAIRLLTRANNLFENMGASSDLVDGLMAIGDVYFFSGLSDDALSHYLKCADVANACNAISKAASAHLKAAKCHRLLEEPEETERCLRASLRLIKMDLSKVSEDPNEVRLRVDTCHEAHGMLVGELVDQGKDNEAFETSELGKIRHVSQLLGMAIGGLNFQSTLPGAAHEDAEIDVNVVAEMVRQQKIEEGQHHLHETGGDEQDRAESEAKNLVALSRGATVPPTSDHFLPDPRTNPKRFITVAQDSKTLKAQASLSVSVNITYNFSSPKLHIFLTGRNIPGGLKRITVEADQILYDLADGMPFSRIVADARRSMDVLPLGSTPSPVSSTGKGIMPLEVLDRILIAPIEEFLPKDTSAVIHIIPDPMMYLVPFAALHSRGSNTPFIAKHAFVLHLTHSLQALSHANRQCKDASGLERENLVFGAPMMPVTGIPLRTLPKLAGIRAEVDEVAAQLQAFNPLTEEACSVSGIERRLGEVESIGVVHFATHGLMDGFGESGNVGQLVLSPTDAETRQGGWTYGYSNWIEKPLRADLAVLSAANLSGGHGNGGDKRLTGEDGMARFAGSLIASGCSSTLISQWCVPDSARRYFFKKFYAKLTSSNNRAVALQAAILASRSKYPKEKFWASFTLFGECSFHKDGTAVPKPPPEPETDENGDADGSRTQPARSRASNRRSTSARKSSSRTKKGKKVGKGKKKEGGGMLVASRQSEHPPAAIDDPSDIRIYPMSSSGSTGSSTRSSNKNCILM